MRDALVASMLAAQVEMDSYKHGFELFGADFMLSEDLRLAWRRQWYSCVYVLTLIIILED